MQSLSATFHLTHHCNLRCSYCFTGEKLPLAMSHKTIDDAIVFLEQELEKSNTKELNITFFGGEPLIEKEKIFYIIDAFESKRDINVSYRMSTNGTLLTEELMQKLYSKGVYISLSIDGHPDVHDQHRLDAAGKPTSHKVEKAAARMLRYNPATNVTCVISPDTADQLCESVDYIYNLGFKYPQHFSKLFKSKTGISPSEYINLN